MKQAHPKVSIHMPSYNHELYIGSAIDSVLVQETSFSYEVVIGDDCSQDNTARIARIYAQEWPDRVRLIENPKNVGIWENDQIILSKCRGEYIAWLEADDMWTDCTKLHKQIELLDSHPEYSACFSRASCLTSSKPPITWKGGPVHSKDFFTVDDLLEQGHFIPSCTAVFRASLAKPALEWTRTTPFLETTYALRFALNGPVGFIDKTMACFRHHAKGVYGEGETRRNLDHAIATHLLVGEMFELNERVSYRRRLDSLYEKLQSLS